MAEFHLGMAGCEDVDEIVRHWPEKSQALVRTIAHKYGAPRESLDSRLIWHNNRPWKQTVIYREANQHNFPASHTDLLAQTINYKVPVGKLADIAAFNGSIVVDRTAGEVTSKCDREGINYLALNIVNDIVQKNVSVEKARAEFGDAIKKMMKGEIVPYAQGFQFDLPKGDTADRDSVTANIDFVDDLSLESRAV